MQPTFTPNIRQRPLQKSMFLQQTDYSRVNHSMQYQYQDIMKRSAIQPQNSKTSSFHFTQPSTPLNQPYTARDTNSQLLSFNNPTRLKQGPRQYQQTITNQTQNQILLQQLQQKIKSLTKLVQSHDQIIKKHQLNKQKPLIDTVLQQIEQRIKQSIVPAIFSKESKEIYQHIFNFKFQISSLKEQVSLLKNDFRSQFTNIKEIVNYLRDSHQSNSSLSYIDKNQDSTKEIRCNFADIEKKILEMQREFQKSINDLKTFILVQIEKNKPQNKAETKLKSSPIQSSLSSIMLEYREFFMVKPHKSGIRIHPRDETQIIINSITYHIDKEGYLLDNQNRYIIDWKGSQIRLDEKHLALLKEHSVLS